MSRLGIKDGARHGKENPFYGKTHSPESLKKMSDNNAMKRPEVIAKMKATKLRNKKIRIFKKELEEFHETWGFITQ